MLDIEELEELLDEIRIKVTIANRDGSLPDLLKKLGIENTIQQPSPRFESYRSGKIVVIGENTVKESVLKKIAEDLGLIKTDLSFAWIIQKPRNILTRNCNTLKNTVSFLLVLFRTVRTAKAIPAA